AATTQSRSRTDAVSDRKSGFAPRSSARWRSWRRSSNAARSGPNWRCSADTNISASGESTRKYAGIIGRTVTPRATLLAAAGITGALSRVSVASFMVMVVQFIQCAAPGHYPDGQDFAPVGRGRAHLSHATTAPRVGGGSTSLPLYRVAAMPLILSRRPHLPDLDA